MTYGGSISRVTMTSRDLERSRSVVTPICLGPIISKMAGDRDSVTIEHLEMAPGEWGIKWSRDR